MKKQSRRLDEAIEHFPVLADEIVSCLAELSPEIVFDGTLGLGGHARRILKSIDSVKSYIAVDIDSKALDRAKDVLAPYVQEGRAQIFQDSYERVESLLKEVLPLDRAEADACLLDFGASTLQLKDPVRGFSFKEEGPLDMRMSQDGRPRAQDILDKSSAKELQHIFSSYGEFRFSKTLARAISSARRKPSNTRDLAALVSSIVPSKLKRRERLHPATQVFQALRIAVNDELRVIERALPKVFDSLSKGGYLLCISFHSLEDRLVKSFFNSRLGKCSCPKDLPNCICSPIKELELLCPRPIVPSTKELEINAASRSAKLRVARKL